MLDQALKCPLTPVQAAFKVSKSSQMWRLIFHPIILSLKYNLNLLKGSFILCRLFSGSGDLSGAIFWGHFSLGINFFQGNLSSRVSYNNYFSTIFFKERRKSLTCMDVLWLTLNMREAFSVISFTTRFFLLSNAFIGNTRLKLAKNQTNAKQHHEAELLTSKNYWHFSSMLSSNNNMAYSEK